ncbi:NF-kappa-B-repressing factor-like isoform X2 [Patiria miniata]|nr:NF-kappa-B-repressing factor-like isoform X2 [Patiria miniata]
MARVQEMGQGITLDEPAAPVVREPPKVTVSKPKDEPQSKPESLLQLNPLTKRSYEEDSALNNKAQKTQSGQSAKERAISGYDARLGQRGGASQSAAWSQPSQRGAGPAGYDKVIADLAYNLKKQTSTSNRGGSALNKLHNAGLRLSLRPEVEYIEIPPPHLPHARRGRGKSPLDNPTWLCNLYMGDTLLASVEAKNKPDSKTAAAEKAVLLLEGSGFAVQNVNKQSKHGRSYYKEVVPHDRQLNSQTFPVNKQNKCGAPPPTWTLENFVLMEPSKAVPATSILINSAQSNHVPILFETSEDIRTVGGKSGFECTTIINGVTVCGGLHMNKREARNVSAENALTLLRKTCPVLRKNLHMAQGSAIKRNELAKGQVSLPPKKASAIEDTNLGHKMLKMMGWSGGALGKDGIVEPIQASEKFTREGLGYTVAVPKNSTNEIDMKAVRRILEDYVHSGRRDDLIFTSELSSEERKAIHQICNRFNLKSKSHGSGKKRYLVVNQKRKLNELVQEIAESGGTCGQYELLTPGKSKM